jgi:predicted enzyme related to lactoylglutathione lyase
MTKPGSFIWYDLMTTDVDAALAFYAPLTGWTAEEYDPANKGYRVLSVDGRGVGGTLKLTDEMKANGAQPGWVGYIYVDDVDASAGRIKAAGGAVHYGPEDIPNVGRFAVVADPQGAVFQIFKPGYEGEMPPFEGEAGKFGWHELYAGDGPSAFDFYAKEFGWTKDRAMDMGPMGVYQLFATGGEAVGGIMTKPEGIPRPVWGYYITVPAIDAAIDKVKANGGHVAHGPMEVPGGSWIIQGADPQGAMFALVAPKR